ncbi:MAG: PorT family protein [Bacteroidota bacterium]|nr:outer membrane beta-barrel protein [Flavisolibacter sp.]MDQ3844571.1 PorT family protein [Bacteroidota bacterium]MBD0293800.1 outer membrane beta-barrel protein [Flavisolibacter sp.]MBD0352865.1 outer membrane beta-barrel protein [Flavisolibacter sp.]MBD0364548.1 outer membrane beta-barrel protein [Flavisolibacter sp.]
MRSFLCFIAILLITHRVVAQNDSGKVARPTGVKPVNMPRSNDHFLIQLGYTTWQGKPDSIKTTGFPRTFNAYFLFDFPFKTNPHLSVAFGAGVATDNIYFSKTNVGIKENTSTLRFRNVADTSHFKKYKLATTYLEAPVELRFSSNPEDNKKSFKIALGAKVGTLVGAATKGKNLQNKSGNNIGSYIQKEKSKHFFNQNRLSATGRIGYGSFSLFVSYSLTPLFKEGLAPAIRPLTVGLTLSGL